MVESSRARRILVVEDDEVFRERLARALRDRGNYVVGASSRTEAAAAMRDEVFDAAVVDLRLLQDRGDGVAADIRKESPKTRVVIASGDQVLLARARADLDRICTIGKPFDADELLEVLEGS